MSKKLLVSLGLLGLFGMALLLRLILSNIVHLQNWTLVDITDNSVGILINIDHPANLTVEYSALGSNTSQSVSTSAVSSTQYVLIKNLLPSTQYNLHLLGEEKQVTTLQVLADQGTPQPISGKIEGLNSGYVVFQYQPQNFDKNSSPSVFITAPIASDGTYTADLTTFRFDQAIANSVKGTDLVAEVWAEGKSYPSFHFLSETFNPLETHVFQLSENTPVAYTNSSNRLLNPILAQNQSGNILTLKCNSTCCTSSTTTVEYGGVGNYCVADKLLCYCNSTGCSNCKQCSEGCKKNSVGVPDVCVGTTSTCSTAVTSSNFGVATCQDPSDCPGQPGESICSNGMCKLKTIESTIATNQSANNDYVDLGNITGSADPPICSETGLKIDNPPVERIHYVEGADKSVYTICRESKGSVDSRILALCNKGYQMVKLGDWNEQYACIPEKSAPPVIPVTNLLNCQNQDLETRGGIRDKLNKNTSSGLFYECLGPDNQTMAVCKANTLRVLNNDGTFNCAQTIPIVNLQNNVSSNINAILDKSNNLPWSSSQYTVVPVNGSVLISTGFETVKGSSEDYDYGVGPGGMSGNLWNTREANFRFGTRVLKPGEMLEFRKEIEWIENRQKVSRLTPSAQVGDGYYGPGNGVCWSASTIAELFGTVLTIDGKDIYLFQAPSGSGATQTHPYYIYKYHSKGIAIAPNNYGRFIFGVNKDLPSSITAQITLRYVDTNPADTGSGNFRTIANLVISGLPSNVSQVKFQRLSANWDVIGSAVGSSGPANNWRSTIFSQTDPTMPALPNGYVFTSGEPGPNNQQNNNLVQANSLTGATGLLKSINAETVEATALKTAGPGQYAVYRNGNALANTSVNVNGNSAEVVLFEDTNENGVFDSSEKLIQNNGEYQITKTSELRTLQLESGWNLVHVPLLLSSENGAAKISNLLRLWNQDTNSLTTAAIYQDGKFITYTDGSAGNDFTVTPDEGIFIKNVGVPKTVNVTGQSFTQIAPLKFAPGWNLVGFTGLKDGDVTSQDLLTKITPAQTEPVVSQWLNGKYTSYLINNTVPYGQTFKLQDTQGYFVRVDKEAEWKQAGTGD